MLRPAAFLVAPAVLLLFAGCVASRGASPSPTPSSPALSCTSLLDTVSLDELADSGFDLTDPATFAGQLRSDGDPFAAFFDAGGILCQIVDGATPVEWYGWAPFTEADSADLRASLVAAGWVETTTDAGVSYDLDPFSDSVVFTCSFDDVAGSACGYDPPRLAEIFGNAPVP